MPFQIVNADITTLRVDAIVNPTDWSYSGSGNTDLAVHTAAGQDLRAECDALPELQTGSVEVTRGYALPSKYIIHTAGPIWINGQYNEPVLLRSCYLNAMLLAKRLGLSSIAFPLISSGAFGFPKDQVLEIAIAAIRDVQEILNADMDVTLCVFDRKSYELSRKYDLEQFLSYAKKPDYFDSVCKMSAMSECLCAPAMAANADNLEDWLEKQDDSFAVTLLKLIDKKGMTDVACYKKAQISKKTFWKINNDPHYKPSKQTVIAFAIALELTLDETEQFLRTVGFSLSHSNTFDMIIEYYITHEIYDLYEINAALYRYDQVCIGC